jgi:NAD(P)-dependent dehydrogenase (short-subunit alcohol dehydrogenase family)
MKTIVITGSTRGIGLGLAEAFLARGCRVMVSGRQPASVDQVVARLAGSHGEERVAGQPCDVTDYAQVEALWQAAVRVFGPVDIWINNAGIGNLLAPFWEIEPGLLKSVVETNLLGTLYGSRVALRGMLQQGFGALYNMEGYGSRGSRIKPGLTPYGTTKAGLAFLDAALAKELEDKPVIVGSLSPGMVVTDLLLDQRAGDPADWERSKRAFNILADRVETVMPWLAEQVLANQENGRRIAWLTGLKVIGRFLAAPFRKRNIIE